MIEKYKKMSKAVKASFWVMFCSILQKGISFITIPIFTRLLTTEEYGMYSLFLSWESIITIFATLNLSYQVFNNGMVKYEKDKDGYTSSMIGLTFISCIISFFLILLFYKPFNHISGLSINYIFLMFIVIFFTAISSIWIVRKRYDFDYKSLTLFTILFSVLNPALGILLVIIMRDKAIARVLSIVICSVLYGIICLILINKDSKKFFNTKYWKYALKIDLPLIPHYLSYVLLSSSDRIMINMLINKEATAIYSVSYNVSMIMNIVITAINSSLIPWIYHQIKEQNFDNLKKKISIILIAVATISVIPMFFGPEVIMILGGKNYMDAASLIPIVSSSIFMIYLFSVFIVIEMYYEKSNYITVGTTLAAIINIITNYFFIGAFGYKAAAYTTLLSYSFLALFHYIMMIKTLKENKVFNNIFDLKILLVLSVTIIAISLCVRYIYDFIIIRYIMLSVIFVVILLFRNRIIQFIKKIKEK